MIDLRLYWFLIFKSAWRGKGEGAENTTRVVGCFFLRKIYFALNGTRLLWGTSAFLIQLPITRDENVYAFLAAWRRGNAVPSAANDHQSRKRLLKNTSITVVFFVSFYQCSCKRRTSPAATLLATTDAARALQQRGRPQQDHPHRLRAPHAPAPQLRQPLATSAHECNRTESPLHATSVSNR